MTFAYRNGTEMAKALAASVSDAGYIRRCVLSNFDWSPSVATIREMQALRARKAEKLRKLDDSRAALPADPPAARNANVIQGSALLLKALWREHPRIVALLRRKQGLGA